MLKIHYTCPNGDHHISCIHMCVVKLNYMHVFSYFTEKHRTDKKKTHTENVFIYLFFCENITFSANKRLFLSPLYFYFFV